MTGSCFSSVLLLLLLLMMMMMMMNTPVRAFRVVVPRVVRSFSSSSSCLHLAAAAAAAAQEEEEEEKHKENSKQPAAVPITLLAGFLGTGKTTALQHLLHNRDNIRVGVIVNDVAAVNVDAKLVMKKNHNDDDDDDASSTNNTAADGMIQLQNGCACCSLADELYMAVQDLIAQCSENLDAIVVELSGVADPVALQNNWKLAPPQITRQAFMSRTVTTVDAGQFGTDYLSWSTVAEREKNQQQQLFENNNSTNDTTTTTAEAQQRKVAELLAEQVEAANLILLNKMDLTDDVSANTAETVIRALNEKATVSRVEYGVVSPRLFLGLDQTIVKDDHHHDHHEASSSSSCADPGCTDTSHSHSHHDHKSDTDCADPGCTDTSHSHSHDHHHHNTASNNNNNSDDCSDPDCTDTSHSHSHDHSSNTSVEELGLTNFVYKSVRPFEPNRMMTLLNQWPVPIKETLDLETWGALDDDMQSSKNDHVVSPFTGVLRSKGFCWFAPTKWSGAHADAWRHNTCMYWSHAGKSFGLTAAGKWWASLPRGQVKKYFPFHPEEYERIMREDFVSDEFGDRRQEIVFIGLNLNEKQITAALEECLLTDEELEDYRQKAQKWQQTAVSIAQ